MPLLTVLERGDALTSLKTLIFGLGAVSFPTERLKIFPTNVHPANQLKTCSYCGAEYPDDAVECAIDHTPFERPTLRPEPNQPENDRQDDLVTVVTCDTLVKADLIVSRLRAAGIETFLPDETLMQVVAWNLNTYGYVRVQVARRDYDAAKALLSENDQAA